MQLAPACAKEYTDNYVIPSVQGDFYLTLKMANDRFGGRGKKAVDTNTLSIHLGSDTRPLLNVSDIIQTPGNDPGGAINRWDREKLGNDKRFLFIPDADLRRCPAHQRSPRPAPHQYRAIAGEGGH